MEIFGERVLVNFARKYPPARKPVQRFAAIVAEAAWPHFAALRETFSAADYVPATGTVIFNLGGNKYRLITVVNFEKQSMVIQKALTHEEYNRENL